MSSKPAKTIKSLSKTVKALEKENKKLKKLVVEIVEQEYLAYIFINNSNKKMHSQLKKDIANKYSKGNTEAYSSDIHKALTLMNEYQPLKLDAPVIAAQGTAFVTSGKGGKGKGAKKYLPNNKWNALSADQKLRPAKKVGWRNRTMMTCPF